MEPPATDDKLTVTPLLELRLPIGGQQLELQQVDYAHGGISLLRIRLREGRRFTVIDIDPVSALQWAEAMSRWGRLQSDKEQGPT